MLVLEGHFLNKNKKSIEQKKKVKVKWCVAKYGDPYSEFVLCIYPILSAHTQQWTHTHREHTPGAVGSHLCCGARGAVGGPVPCSRAPQSWYWRWRERCTFTPPTYNSCQTWDLNPRPLGYESDSLTIRPRLIDNASVRRSLFKINKKKISRKNRERIENASARGSFFFINKTSS